MSTPGKQLTYRRFAIAYVVVIALIVLAATSGWGQFWAVIYAVPGADKLAHVILLGGLTVAIDVLMGQRRLWRVVPTAGVVLLLIATVEEGVQFFVPTRTFDLLDLACNYLGIVGASAFLAMRGRRDSRS